ncbi:MAG TPA: hypothetical protein P5205_02060 [Candidatus Paceibacterota bacterium]|nr:hypothetical protein [Verrucomicrobiota bacterium]HSA09131.1 hypothetical protein [Candidatus Paceibacterota bacterium]
MNDDRKLVVHYNNGTRLEISFPIQVRNSQATVLEAMKRIMESDKIAFEAEGRLIVIPWASVARLEVSPTPASLPFGVIKNAKLEHESTFHNHSR